jgi:hypothetical protein
MVVTSASQDKCLTMAIRVVQRAWFGLMTQTSSTRVRQPGQATIDVGEGATTCRLAGKFEHTAATFVIVWLVSLFWGSSIVVQGQHIVSGGSSLGCETRALARSVMPLQASITACVFNNTSTKKV